MCRVIVRELLSNYDNDPMHTYEELYRQTANSRLNRVTISANAPSVASGS
jgi:hypothetical protein